MRNFFVYARSRDNQFFSCSVIVDCQEGIEPDTLAENLVEAAKKRFLELGNPLPEPDDLLRFRAIIDPRNDLDEKTCPYTPQAFKRRYKAVKTFKGIRNV